ncbi:MAG: tetratricopeptide repeat protein [Pyrinomonadaceae bacterium]
MPYDLFISYSRKDNLPAADGRPGWLDAFVAELGREHRRFSTVELNVFFDKSEIRVMDDWKLRILAALRQSKLLLAFLSPNYFASPYCRWEWEEYVRHESSRAVSDNGIAPIYFVEVPGFESGQMEQQIAHWVDDLRRREFCDLRPWISEGIEALQREDVRRRLELLDQQLSDRLEQAERAAAALGNVDRHNENFVGRSEELRSLREMLATKKVGMVTLLHGLGGIGKSALANQYSHAFADAYSGGRWLVRCEGQDDLRAALLHLAADPQLRVEFTDAEKKDLDLALRRVLLELEKRSRDNADAKHPPACLLVLDNVDRPALLSPVQVDRLPKADWLHLLATTRLTPNQLFNAQRDRAFLALDELPESDGLRLIELHQPGGRFANDAEREAAREIVRRLGGFTLAVEGVAVFLGLHDEISCAGFLERLKQEGLAAPEDAAGHEQVRMTLRHREKQISSALGPTLAQLSSEEHLALSYAALLPADQIPLPWLRALASEQFPGLRENPSEGRAGPWRQIERRLLGHRLLIRTAEFNVVRMHRLVQELVANNIEPNLSQLFRDLLIKYAATRWLFLEQEWLEWRNRWEIESLRGFAEGLLDSGHRLATYIANSTALRLLDLARYADAEPLMWRALEIDEQSYGPNHPNVATDLDTLAQLLQATKRLGEAEPLMRRALEIAEQSYGPDHPNVGSTLNNLAQLLQDTNRLGEAEPLMRRALEIAEQSYGPDHPNVGSTLNNLAQLLQATNRLEQAELLMRRALEIAKQSYGLNHPNVATDLNNLAQLLQDTNRLAEAEPLMRRALEIDEQSYGPNHPNVGRDLNNLAQLLQATNRLADAEPLMRRALEIHEQSCGSNHPDVAIDLNNLALLLQATNRLAEAEPLMQRALEIDEQSYGPNHTNVGRDLNNLAQLLQDTNRLAEAEPLKRRALEIAEQSYGPNHPDVAMALNNLAVLLGATNRLAEAEPLMRRNVEILYKFTVSTGHEHPHIRAAISNYADLLQQIGGSEQDLAQLNAIAKALGIEVKIMNPMQQNILKMFGLDVLPADKQEEALERIDNIVFRAVMLRVVDVLTDAQADAFDKLLDTSGGNPEAIFTFLRINISDFDTIVAEEVQKLKAMSDALLNKSSAKA